MGYKRSWVELSELVGRPALLQTTCFHTLWNIISYGHERIPRSLISPTENNNYFFSPQRTQGLFKIVHRFFFFQASRKLTFFTRIHSAVLQVLVKTLCSLPLWPEVGMSLFSLMLEKRKRLTYWFELFTSSIHFERFSAFTWITFCVRKVVGPFPSGTQIFFSMFFSSHIWFHLLLIFCRWKIIIYCMD